MLCLCVVNCILQLLVQCNSFLVRVMTFSASLRVFWEVTRKRREDTKGKRQKEHMEEKLATVFREASFLPQGKALVDLNTEYWQECCFCNR